MRVPCRVLRVSAAGYCDWLRRQPRVTDQQRAELAAAIRAIHAAVKGRSGSPRAHAELVARQSPCSVNAVARIVKPLGLQAISHRTFRVRATDSNHEFPVAGNELDRDFTATKANEIWLGDITVIPTREGWLDPAAVEDLYSRRVVGWSMGTTPESRLVVDALHPAVAQRFPDAGLLRIRIGAASTPASTTSGCCPSTASRAA